MSGKMARSDPRPSVRATRGVGSGQHLASVLQEGRENANIDAGLGFIWRISGEAIYRQTKGHTMSRHNLMRIATLATIAGCATALFGPTALGQPDPSWTQVPPP